MSILDKVNYPEDIKNLSIEELGILSEDVRQLIIKIISKNGGHLASALGVVELTVALHYMFDSPYDKLIFDVGHQSYAHKILTGRKKSFHTIRQLNGENSFTRSNDSEYDSFISGHSSTSLSVAAGLMRARELKGEDYNIISIIGDGAFTGGMVYEALNDSGNIKGKQIIILNDNSMSISKSVGAIADYLAKMHTKRWYNKLKLSTKRRLTKPKKNRLKTLNFLKRVRNSIKYLLQGALPFDEYGIKYFGPVDGHNIPQLLRYLQIAKNESKTVIIHIVTVKGKGYPKAVDNPDKYHGISPYNENKPEMTYSTQIGKSLSELAKVNNKIIAITAAMSSGTGLNNFSKEFPDRFFDVGIAEAHAVTMCAAMASQGFKPYFAVYSTFLQRGFDQIIHDICIEKHNVTLLIDRSGIIGPDGETHQGIFDISYLNLIPNMTITSPMNIQELDMFIKWSENFNEPLAIRYPKGGRNLDYTPQPIELGKWSIILKGNKDTVIVATGADMVFNAYIAAKETDSTLINARFIKPYDKDLLLRIQHKRIITIEDNVLNGGLFSLISSFYSKNQINANITPIGIFDNFIPQGTKEELFIKYGVDTKSIINTINN